MKIHVDDIPAEGLDLKEAFEPQEISLDLELQGVIFTKSIEVGARIMRSGAEVFCDVALEAPVEYTCGRCLAKFTDVFKRSFNVSYEAKPREVLNIDEDIRQELMLNYPTKLLCKSDCKGLCQNCGQNFNVADCECTK